MVNGSLTAHTLFILIVVLEEQQLKEIHPQEIIIPKVGIVIQIPAVLVSQR